MKGIRHLEETVFLSAGEAGRKKLNRYTRRKERFWELDFLRGLCVALMILDHFMFCVLAVAPMVNDILGTSVLESAYGFAERFDESAFIESARFIVRCCFFALCGVSCTLSKNNFIRFLPLAMIALFMNGASAVLNVFSEGGFTVYFGVFHMLSCSVLAFALIDGAAGLILRGIKDGEKRERAEDFLRFLPAVIGAVLLALYFTRWGRLVADGGLTVTSAISASGNARRDFLTGMFVDLKGNTPYAGNADYFPLLPYGAIVLCGCFVGRGIYHTDVKNALKPLDGAWNAGTCFIGRHAALFYLGQLVGLPAVVVFGALAELIFA